MFVIVPVAGLSRVTDVAPHWSRLRIHDNGDL